MCIASNYFILINVEFAWVSPLRNLERAPSKHDKHVPEDLDPKIRTKLGVTESGIPSQNSLLDSADVRQWMVKRLVIPQQTLRR